ncbi:MAG: carboxymuconolactone decarboxylase family protein [Saprospiraceae bacterium]|nr:carboxymuconolactone decarboxylase family protein [Saprospiraceae bacterium]
MVGYTKMEYNMTQHSIKYLASFALLVSCFSFGIKAQNNTDTSNQLSNKEKQIIAIAAHAAQGNIPKLHTALNNGLDAGLSIGEEKEMLIQLYAYTGFPRSLNALTELMAVLAKRKNAEIKDATGETSSPFPSNKTLLQIGTDNQAQLTGRKIGGGVYEFAPVMDQYLKEHLFGAIFGRDILDWKTREMVTIAALSSMEGVEPQLRSHFGVGMHNGLTQDQLSELVTIIEKEVDTKRGEIARQILQSVIDQKPYKADVIPYEPIFEMGQKTSNDNFTGTIYHEPLIKADTANQVSIGNVTFEPGARTNWHYHPGGQVLLVTNGKGRYQELGQAVREIQKGDVIKCEPNIPHWHGAAPNTAMTHIAIGMNQHKGAVVWLLPVTDTEYNAIQER